MRNIIEIQHVYNDTAGQEVSWFKLLPLSEDTINGWRQIINIKAVPDSEEKQRTVEKMDESMSLEEIESAKLFEQEYAEEFPGS